MTKLNMQSTCDSLPKEKNPEYIHYTKYIFHLRNEHKWRHLSCVIDGRKI